jgi:CheY-like chemotaxis protein
MVPMSGLNLLNEIRRNTETKTPSVILMSARKEPEWILARKKGADCINQETVQRWYVEDKNHSAWLVELSAFVAINPLRPANEEQLSMA